MLWIAWHNGKNSIGEILYYSFFLHLRPTSPLTSFVATAGDHSEIPLNDIMKDVIMTSFLYETPE